jgi:hypothetical protein
MADYKGVKPGSTKDEVHQKLGKPKSESELDEDYDLGNGNTINIQYGPDKTVQSIVFYFTSHDDKVPRFEDVVGDAKIEKNQDGSQTAKSIDASSRTSITMYQTGGDSSMTIITIRQLQS